MDYNVGPGVLARMNELGDEPAGDEYFFRRKYGKTQWSITPGKSGRLYTYLFETNETQVHEPTALVAPPTPIGTITTRFGTPPADLQDGVRAHFPEEQWTNACEVSYYESGWNAEANNNTLDQGNGACGAWYFRSDVGWCQTEDSWGYFQVNRCVYGETPEYWQNADNAARKAAELWRGRGQKWTDWIVSAGRLGLPV